MENMAIRQEIFNLPLNHWANVGYIAGISKMSVSVLCEVFLYPKILIDLNKFEIFSIEESNHLERILGVGTSWALPLCPKASSTF